jgi:CheY-like chemotaxis protein/signal transduction histidine kinase
MRRIYLLLIGIILVLVTANIYYYLNIYKQQVNFQKNILIRQTETCSWEIEQHTANFMNEINYILFTEDISQFFSNTETMESSSMKMEVFFSKYKDLITNISLYDNEKNVYTIFKDRNNTLVTNIYISRVQRDLLEKETLEELREEYVFILPAFTDNTVLANIVVRIDTRKYVESVFNNYHIDNTLWQWLINNQGDVVFSTFGPGILKVRDAQRLLDNWPVQNKSGSLIHKLGEDDGLLSVISTFYPIKVMNQDMLVVFSLDTGIVVSSILTSIITISAATFIVLVLIILLFLYFIRNERREKQKSKESEQAIKDIFESLPTGIIIKGPDGIIKMINSTALDILKIDDAQSVLGKDFSNMFFLLRDYPDNSRTRQKENTSEFVYYGPDEKEVILYKKEILASFLGEEVLVEAFIDISPIEYARKKEFIFGEAKTEFLKRISHDIRNPLNGIINMIGSLESEIDPGPSEKEKIDLVRRCSDDILFVINDIMDFSGFESGSTLVEEVPFVLREEIENAVVPFLNKAHEKNIEIKTTLLENVPKILIGDPFHIRQILTNLLSNSLKYTIEGEIKLTAKIKKQIAGNILLEFIIEDTGTGISPGLLENLNQQHIDQTSLSEGSFGLMKTRQLINLMKGDVHIESPVTENPQVGGPGTKVIFHVQVFSNEVSGKKLKFEHIRSYKDIRALILAEQGENKPEVRKMLVKLGISCETTNFNNSTIDLIKSRMTDPASSYSIIVIIDSEKSNGFSIVRKIHEKHLDNIFLIIFISSANKPGNFLKSRRFGADHYIIEPYEGSEIFDIIQNNFPHAAMPVTKETHLKKVRPGLKILVAEDNHVNQIVAKSLFKSIGFEIDIASNGKEALKKVTEKNYDIVFMDIRMPEKNGLDTTYEIRNLGYRMPIVAMTANVGEMDKTKAMEVGMNDFIAKPVRADLLKDIIIKKFSE